MTVEAVLRSA